MKTARLLFPLGLLVYFFLFAQSCDPNVAEGDYLYPDESPKGQVETEDESEGEREDYRDTNRDLWQKPEMIFDLLGDLTDKTVADIGAGTGWFTLRLAPHVGKVIALDVDPAVVAQLDSTINGELEEAIRDRVDIRLVPEDDPQLKSNEVDAVLIVNTFAYMPNRAEYLAQLKSAIKPNGKLIIVDFKRRRTPVGPPSDVRIPLYKVEDLLYQVGFQNIEVNDTALDYQWIIVGEV